MNNIETTIQLNKLIEQQNKLFEAQGKMIKNQLATMQQMVETLNQYNPAQKSGDIRELNNVLDEMTDKVEKVGSASTISEKDFEKLVKSSLGGSGKISKAFGSIEKSALGFIPVVSIFESMIGSFKLMKNGLLGITTFATAAVGSLIDLAFSVITFPFKILKNLIDLAGNHNDTALRQALEDIRKEFGDLHRNGSRAIIDISRGLRGQLAETGLSTWRVFGNLAERLNSIREYATNMANAFDLVRNSFVANAGRVAAYIKGLGLAEEGQKALAETAIRTGKSLQEIGREMTTYAYGVGEAFGFNGKMVSRDVGKMMADFENFGNLGAKVMTNVSIYARRLGVEFEKLLGVVDKFDNFEDAAQGAAQLSQAFGIQLDTLSLINEQDPAARVEQLRKAFFAAGRTVENMTRQERALLASQTGLDQNTLSLAFSLKSQSKSYADIQRQSDATKKKQLSQAEAMDKLANSIERLVKEGHFGEGGFFDRFLQGFSMGIRRSWEFRKVLYDLRNSLRIVYFAGIRVGRDFVRYFPGVQKFLHGLQDIFNPRTMRKKMNEVISSFRTFFQTIQTEPKKALKKLFDSLHETFFGNFSLEGSGGKKILQGVKTFAKAFGNVFASFLEIGMRGLRKGLGMLLDFLKDPSGFIANAQSASTGFTSIIIDFFKPIGQAFINEGPGLLQAASQLFRFVFEKLKDKAIELAREYWPVVAKGLVSVVAMNGFIAVVRVGIAWAFKTAIEKAISSFSSGGGAKGMFSKLFSSMQKTSAVGLSKKAATGLSAQGEALSKAIEGAGSASEATSKAKVSMATVGKMLVLAAVIGVGMYALVQGIVHVAKEIQSNGLSPTSIALASGVMLAAGGAMLEIAGVVAALALVGPALSANAGPVAAGAVGIVAVAGAMGLMMYGAVKAFGNINESKIDKTVKILNAANGFFLTAAAVTGVAALVGAGVIATGGVGAVAILAGLAALGAVVTGMAATIGKIMDTINGIQVNDSAKAKLDSYLKVFGAITDFASAVGRIMGGATSNIVSGIIDAIQGRGSPVKQLTTFVKTLGEQTTSLVANVVEQAQKINATQEELKKIQVIGRVLSSLANFAKNVVPRQALSSSLFDSSVSNKLDSLSRFLGNVVTHMQDGIRIVVRSLKWLIGGDVNIDALKAAAEATSSIIAALGTLASKILISTVQYIKGDNLEKGLDSVGKMMNTVITSIVESGIFTKINQFIKGISEGISPEATEKLKTLTPIITGAMGIVGQITNIISQANFKGSPSDVAQKTNSLNEFISAISTAFTVQFGTVIDDLVSKFSNITTKKAGALQRGITALSGLFEVVGNSPELLKQLNTIGTEAISSSFEKMQVTISKMSNLFTGENGLESMISQIPDRGIAKITEGATAMVESIKSIHETINGLKGVDINADLRVLNDRLGLGANKRLTIDQGNLQMNITVNVKLDVEELEEVLTTRPNGSRFVLSDRNPWRGGTA